MSSDSRRCWMVLLLSLLLGLLSSMEVLSAPVPPKLVVNHSSKECGEIFGGDECMDCLPSEGWEVLGFAKDEGIDCPEGYSWVDPPYTCKGFKDEFCCTEYHSGAPGDCDDMVIRNWSRSCAFIEDIEQCVLPLGWKGQADASDDDIWHCPSGFTWTEAPACRTAGAEAESLLPLIVLVLLGVVVVLIAAIVAITLVIRRLRA